MRFPLICDFRLQFGVFHRKYCESMQESGNKSDRKRGFPCSGLLKSLFLLFYLSFVSVSAFNALLALCAVLFCPKLHTSYTISPSTGEIYAKTVLYTVITVVTD